MATPQIEVLRHWLEPADGHACSMEPVPWKRAVADTVEHPAYAFHCRVGELTDTSDERAGHIVIVVSTTWSGFGGLLPWRRWGAPVVFADLFLIPPDSEPDTLLEDDELEWDFVDEELNAAVENWTRGEATLDENVYRVEWLSVEAGDAIAMECWGWDLPGQRERRTRRGPWRDPYR